MKGIDQEYTEERGEKGGGVGEKTKRGSIRLVMRNKRSIHIAKTKKSNSKKPTVFHNMVDELNGYRDCFSGSGYVNFTGNSYSIYKRDRI